MFGSIKDDIKATFSYGNMVNKIIIVNVGVYMVFAIINAFAPTFYAGFVDYFSLPSRFSEMIRQPWSLITHMFLHEGVWHLAWNMMIFYTFGNIFGDLLGDRKVLPLYLMGGLLGAILFLCASQFFPSYFYLGAGHALGASAAVMGIIFAAVAIAPDYYIHLLLLGPVRIKFIGLAILFFDIIGTRAMSNSGGHIMHLGGIAFGFLFVFLLKKGTDLSSFEWKTERKSKSPRVTRSSKSLTVVSDNRKSKTKQAPVVIDQELQIDIILEKIKRSGFDSLTKDEKEALENASKND
jgi:membrane associated rhomboid family serine protease